MATLLSVNVGLPRNVDWRGRTVYTGAWKSPVDGPRMVRRLNVEGDGQGDLGGHGGEQRAVLVYQRESYDHWRKQLGREDLEFGWFGENFTVDGLPDDEVCVGDRYRIGGAEFEVTQPRVTCYRVGLRLGEPAMPSLLVSHHRPGFYLRVITEGRVRAGDAIVRTRVGPGALSVADVDGLLYLPDRDPDRLKAALAIPALSPGWQQSFRELADTAGQPAAAGGPSTRTGWDGFRPLRVARIVAESSTVSSLYLEPVDRQALPPAEPGQYLTLRITGATDPAPAPAPVRSYSLSSAPGAPQYRISVKREPHGVVSTYLHTTLRTGAVLEAASPRGDFVLADDRTRPTVLVSAGIGVTPVLAMLYQLAAEADPGPVWWIHTTRDRAQHAFADEAHQLLARLPDAHEHVFYTAPTESDLPLPPGAVHGRLTPGTLAGLGIPAAADAYLCGPEAFMADLRTALGELGLSTDRIHSERFGALGAINPGVTTVSTTPPHQPPGAPATGPLVTFTRSGLSTRWAPSYPSLLDLAEACDVPTRWSCRTGVCHTCTTPVVSGLADHTPPPLEAPAAGEILICCATPTTDLLLDL
ncbi:MOSC domain-containing protein [Streptacidiphilus sp. N1-3]|uniref:MOSC domain-containing protein n=1 Tax=Streptacidiphilus alkalitolerans TaxID=3342712 RepID=A0ABV6X048_9ACTN